MLEVRLLAWSVLDAVDWEVHVYDAAADQLVRCQKGTVYERGDDDPEEVAERVLRDALAKMTPTARRH